MKRAIVYFAAILLVLATSSPLWIFKVLQPGELYGKLFYFVYSSNLNELVGEMEKAGLTYYKWYEGQNLEAGIFNIKETEMRNLPSQAATSIIFAAKESSIKYLWASKREIGWLIFAGYEDKYKKDMVMSFLYGELPDSSLECSIEAISSMTNGSCFKALSQGWYLWFNW